MSKLKYKILDRPERKMILKWSKNATDYFEYVEEIGCGNNDDSAAWDILTEIKDALFEPVGVWFDKSVVGDNRGTYAHGVEVPSTYRYSVPEGFDIIDLQPCKYLVFVGESYDENKEQQVISDTMEQIEGFDTELIGLKYDYDKGPIMQLKPKGNRGYIELRPVVEINE